VVALMANPTDQMILDCMERHIRFVFSDAKEIRMCKSSLSESSGFHSTPYFNTFRMYRMDGKDVGVNAFYDLGNSLSMNEEICCICETKQKRWRMLCLSIRIFDQKKGTFFFCSNDCVQKNSEPTVNWKWEPEIGRMEISPQPPGWKPIIVYPRKYPNYGIEDENLEGE